MKLLFMDAESGNAQVKGKKKGQLRSANVENQFTRLMKKANMFQANIAGAASKHHTGPLAKSDHLGQFKFNAPDKQGLASLVGRKKGDSLLAQPQNALGLLELTDKVKILIQKGVRQESIPQLSEKLKKLNKLMDDLGSGEMGLEGESLLARLKALSQKKGKGQGKEVTGAGTEEPKKKTNEKPLLPMGISMDVAMIEGKVTDKKAPGKAKIPDIIVGDPRGQRIRTKGAIAANKAMNLQLPEHASDKHDNKGDGKLALKHKAGALKISADLKMDTPLPAELMEKVLEKVKGEKAKGAKEKDVPLEPGQGHGVEGKAVKRPQIHTNTGVRLNEAEVVQLTRQWTALKNARPKKAEPTEAQSPKKTNDLVAATRRAAKALDVSTVETAKVFDSEGVNAGAVKVKDKKVEMSLQERNLKKADGKTVTQGKTPGQSKAPTPTAGPIPDQKTPSVDSRVETATISPDALVEEILTGKVGRSKPQANEATQFRDGIKSVSPATGPEAASQVKANGSEPKTLPQPMFNQMTEGLRQAYILRPRAITVKLTPDDLGEIKVKVAIENDQLRAQIHTDSQKVAAIIKDHQGDLEHRLREQGIQLDKFDVKEESQQFGERNRGSGRHEMNGDGQPGGQQNADDNHETGLHLGESAGEQSREDIRAAVEDGAPLNITV